MKALVVGLGSIGRRHASNWSALGLGPVVVAHQTDDLDAVLSSERPDVVLVTNPTSLHVDTACKAIRAGAHVFIEKPIGHQLPGLPELLEAAKHTRRVLMVGYNLRFHPGLARLKELVQQHAIGKIVSARAEVGEYLPDWHPWEDYRRSYSGRSELGGGAVLTFSHELDSLCWLLGAPRRVMAIAVHASSLETDTEDVAEIALHFECGALGSVHVDYVRRPARRSLELTGEDGILHWEYEANRLLHYAPATRQWRIEEGDRRFDRNDMYLAELRHFASCARGEVQQPLVDGTQGAAILAVASAAKRSSAEGRSIDFQLEGELVTTWLSSLGKP
jgi:predicted dehydrogenase